MGRRTCRCFPVFPGRSSAAEAPASLSLEGGDEGGASPPSPRASRRQRRAALRSAAGPKRDASPLDSPAARRGSLSPRHAMKRPRRPALRGETSPRLPQTPWKGPPAAPRGCPRPGRCPACDRGEGGSIFAACGAAACGAAADPSLLFFSRHSAEYIPQQSPVVTLARSLARSPPPPSRWSLWNDSTACRRYPRLACPRQSVARVLGSPSRRFARDVRVLDALSRATSPRRSAGSGPKHPCSDNTAPSRIP